MNVFVLCTGRNGSVSFANACKHITNYSSSHESRCKLLGEKRLAYPPCHIEVDNRLSWFLGRLDAEFGKEAYYVHLIRDKKATANSYKRRWKNSIVRHYCEGILKTPRELLNQYQKQHVCEDYCRTVNENITFFLKDKPKQQRIALETIEKDFLLFWDKIGAEGDLQNARDELKRKHNASKKIQGRNILYTLKLKAYAIKNKLNL